MKKQVLLFAVLIVVGAMFGSFFTYSFFIKQTPAQAIPVTSPSNISMSSKPLYIIGADAVVNAVKKLTPSVVYITTRSVFNSGGVPPQVPEEFRWFFSEPFNMPQVRKGSGSGIIITSDGKILTNQHVIEGADQILVKVDTNGSGRDRTYKAKVIGSDKLTDIAILKIDATNLKAAVLGDSDKTQIGEWVIAVGNPYGYEHTVTVGVLSAKGRDLTGMGREYPNLLQTDAAINPGNSGGPLANLKGEVIGVNTAIHRLGQGIGFAIPINRVKEIEKQLIANGRVIRPYIGIQMMEMDEAKAEYLDLPVVTGVLVYRVLSGSPADIAGLKRGDVILEVDGNKIDSPKDLQKAVRSHKVGDTVHLTVWRNKKKIKIKLKVAEMPSSLTR